MADVYEQNLPQKTNLTTNDYVRVVGSDDVSYKQPLSDVAQKTIENYAGSTLAGSTQSVKGAIDGLKSSATADKAELNASINEVASDLANESSTRASQDTNLQAQINQLVAPTGTAPNPAEIENARIGADNVTYTTLGDAIRTQVTDLKSGMSDLAGAELKISNIAWIANTELNEHGEESPSGTWHTSPFIEIPYTTKDIIFTKSTSDAFDQAWNFYYDENHTMISQFSTALDALIPNGARYLRLSCNSQLSYTVDFIVNVTDTLNDIFQDAKNNALRYFDPCFVRAVIDDTSGEMVAGYRPVSTLIKTPFKLNMVTDTDYKFRAFYYDKGKSLISATGWLDAYASNEFVFYQADANFVRLMFDAVGLPNNEYSPTPNLAHECFKCSQLVDSADIVVEPSTIGCGFEKVDYEIINNSYPDSSGAFQPYANWNRSDFIPISNGDVIYINNTAETRDNAYYDANKAFIKNFTISGKTPAVVVPPQNARYMVISNSASSFFGDVYRKASASVLDFVQNNIDGVCTALDAIQTENTSSVFFMTDLHMDAFNTDYTTTFMPIQRALEALKKIDERNAIDFVTLGGDYLWNNTDTTKALATAPYAFLQQMMYAYRDRCFALKGNHDDNSIAFSAQGANGLILPDEEYRYIGKQYEKSGAVFNPADHNFYGYYDIPSQKIRVIFVNTVDIPYEISGGSLVYNGQHMTAISQKQNEFIQDALHFEESGWAVLFMAHHGLCNSSLYDTSEDYTNNLWEVIKAFKNKTAYSGTITNPVGSYQVSVDYTNNASNEVIACITGHNHADRSAVVDGILNVSTGTACGEQESEIGGTNISPTYDTSTETLFDIFTIDRATHKLYATRYGLGNSREWTY